MPKWLILFNCFNFFVQLAAVIYLGIYLIKTKPKKRRNLTSEYLNSLDLSKDNSEKTFKDWLISEGLANGYKID